MHQIYFAQRGQTPRYAERYPLGRPKAQGNADLAKTQRHKDVYARRIGCKGAEK